MASVNTLCKILLNVKGAVVEGNELFRDENGVLHIRILARPNFWHQNECPYCHKRCPGYDRATKSSKIWRGLDWGGVIVEIESGTHRITCPVHGTVTADVPWAYSGSSFTKEFDRVVGWLAVHLPRSAVSELMRIDWKTVGRCVQRTLDEIEPERARRLDGLVNIGIDETSYKKGHKYITVVVNHDTNTVVWVAQGHGKAVLTKFYKQLTPKQLSSIKVVTGDGARWITECVNEFTPDCERCVDPFHVVQWAMEALDEVRREDWREIRSKVLQLEKGQPRKPGRPRLDSPCSQELSGAREKAETIKHSAYVLGKAPEHLTEKQQLKLDLVVAEDPRLYRAYGLKERLRLLLKITDPEEAERELKSWFWKASHSRIPAIYELNKKIRRHAGHILNAIRFGMSNARIEAINNKIKLVVRKAYGFRNIQNMLDMVYLVCSNLEIPLPNRKLKPA